MTWGDYIRVCLGEIKREQNITRHTRLILSALTGKDPRQLIELPGDYDHLQARTKDEVNEMLRKLGKQDWIMN